MTTCGITAANFDTSISQEMAQISIEPISQRFGQIMRNELIDLLTPKGTPKSPKYRLFVHLTEKTPFPIRRCVRTLPQPAKWFVTKSAII